ncbi:MAG: glycosyltransferase family 2 protein [Ignisphaera sp.]|nr:glycosyltransferase family 2 protein [Ignisphaera sp.]
MLSEISLALVTFSLLFVSLYHTALLHGYGKNSSRTELSDGGAKGFLSIITPIKNEPVDIVVEYSRYYTQLLKGLDAEAIVVADYTNDKLFNSILNGFEFNDRLFLVRRFNGFGGRNGAINDGARLSIGDVIAVIDVDAYPTREVLERMSMCRSVCVARWRICHFGSTRIGKTIAFVTDYGSWLYYKLKSLKDLFIYPLGSGTAIRRNLFFEIGGLNPEFIQDDIWLGTQLIRRGLKPRLVGEMCVGAPSTLPAFLIQQRRWAYGTTQVLRRCWRNIVASPLRLGVKLEAFLYITQPLISMAAGLGFLLAIPASILESSKLRAFGVALLLVLVVAMVLESKATRTFAREVQIYDPPFVYGRASALSTVLSVAIVPYVIAALIGVRIPYRVTPKGREDAKDPTVTVLVILYTLTLIASIIRGNSVTTIVSALILAASVYTLLKLR